MVALLYLYKNTSLHLFVLLMTIEDGYFSYTGCNNVNGGIITVSVSPVCLWVPLGANWVVRQNTFQPLIGLFQLSFVSVLWSFCLHVSFICYMLYIYIRNLTGGRVIVGLTNRLCTEIVAIVSHIHGNYRILRHPTSHFSYTVVADS